MWILGLKGLIQCAGNFTADIIFILLSCLGDVTQDNMQDDSYGNSIEFV